MISDSRWLFKANCCVKSCDVAHVCTACDTHDKDLATETDRTKQIERDTLCSLTTNLKYLIHKYSFKNEATVSIDITFRKATK